MNKQPLSSLQTDARWKNKPYWVSGETSTIGSAGCGPTCAVMRYKNFCDSIDKLRTMETWTLEDTPRNPWLSPRLSALSRCRERRAYQHGIHRKTPAGKAFMS